MVNDQEITEPTPTPEEVPDYGLVPLSPSDDSEPGTAHGITAMDLAEHIEERVVRRIDSDLNARFDELIPNIVNIFEHRIETRIEESYYKSHQGPLPSPETYRQYAEIIPEGSDRIMRMAEKEQDHRHAMDFEDSRRKNKEQDRADRGVNASTLIGITGLAVSALFAALGAPVEGASLAAGTLVALTSTFIWGTSTASAARKEELKSLQQIAAAEASEAKTEHHPHLNVAAGKGGD